MATVKEIQAELDPLANNKQIVILKQQAKVNSATTDWFYCIGGQYFAGRARWILTTNTESAADQAADILAGMA